MNRPVVEYHDDITLTAVVRHRRDGGFNNGNDQPNWVENVLEVWNGTGWVDVWSSSVAVYDAPTAGGPGWNLQTYDVTAMENAAMRVRFGLQVDQTNQLYLMSDWNVDDVAVTSAVCP